MSTPAELCAQLEARRLEKEVEDWRQEEETRLLEEAIAKAEKAEEEKRKSEEVRRKAVAEKGKSGNISVFSPDLSKIFLGKRRAPPESEEDRSCARCVTARVPCVWPEVQEGQSLQPV